MSNSILTIVSLYVVFELAMIALSCKLNSFLFTFHTVLFKIVFLVPFILCLHFRSNVMVSYGIVLYFVSTFLQDIFFKKYHSTKLSIPMLFIYLLFAVISIALIILNLYLYTLYLIPLCALLGFYINKNNTLLQN